MPSKSKGALVFGASMGVMLYLALLPLTLHADDRSNNGPGADLNQALYIKVHFKVRLNRSALKLGDTLEAELSEPVFSDDREIFQAGLRVRLTVDKLERRHRAPNDRWPWVIKVFAPRHENHPVFSAATVLLPDGKEVALRVSLISLADKKDVYVKWRTQKTANAPKGSGGSASMPYTTGTTATFEGVALTDVTGGRAASAEAASVPDRLPGQTRIEGGTQARVILLGDASASKSKAGDIIAARLVEPIMHGSTVLLPQGSVFEGTIVKATRPRFLSRSGSLLLAFDRVILPGGVSSPVSASIIGAELDADSHITVDPEGTLSGGRPGKAWMLLNLGMSAGIAKAADDTTELVIGVIVSTATEASTAGVARIVGACVSGVFLVTRHGRDVRLPRFTEMRIVLEHPVSVPAIRSQQAGTR